MATRQWITVQKNTFTNWTNDHLKDTGRYVEDLETDLDDGVALIKLLEVLAPGKKMPTRYYTRPRIPIHKMQNLAIAFHFMREMEEIELVNIGPSDLTEHNLKLVLGLIWTLILRYKLHLSPSTTISSKADIDTKETRRVKTSIRKILLQWIRSILKGSHITNFTTDWNDGIHLSALIDYCQPGLIPSHASLSKDNALQNIVHAMKLAEECFGIPQVMQPEDLAVDKPDELSVMTYLSYFCSPGSPGEKALLLWVQQQVTTLHLTITNLTTDWTDGRVLGALVNTISGGRFPEYEQLSPENGLENCRRSMDAAEKLLGVTKMFEPEEFSSPHLDELRRMAYLTQFYRAMHAQAHGSRLIDDTIDAAAHKVEVGQLQYPEETGIGRVVSIDLDCSQAGSGVVRAEVVGNTSGRIDVKVDMIGPDSYRVKFEPLKPDLYILSIYYGKNQVKGSPFSINLHLPEAGKVQHLGTSLPKDSEGPVALEFDTMDAGRGMLMVQASGEMSGSTPIKIEAKANGTYTIYFKPLLPDIYKVDVQWGKFSAHAAGSTVGPVPIEVVQEPNNDYKVSFRPPHPDVYKVDVNWGGKPVPGSPFIINLLPPVQPNKVICGLPIYAGVGGAIDLPIDVSSAGFGKLTASCRGEEAGEVPVKVVGPVKKPYQLSFLPPRNDLYKLSVFYDDIEIQSSPYIIDLRSGTLKLSELEMPDFDDLETSYEAESEISFSVDTDKSTSSPPIQQRKEISKVVGKSSTFVIRLQGQEKKRAKITASAFGDKTGPTDVLVAKRSEGVFEIHFNPSKPDRYTIAIMSNKQPIPQSPIIITYLPLKSDASKCRILNLHDIHQLICVNEPIYITVDTSQAGEGKLEATAEGVWGDEEPPKVEVTPTKELPHVYRITYLPLSLSTHKLNLLWSSAPIPDSPLWFTAYNPDTVETFLHSKVVSVDFNSDARERDIKAHAIHDDTRTQVKVKISKVKGQYKLAFQPKESGLYRLHVFVKEKEIKRSPFLVRVGAVPRPEGIIVTGLEEHAIVREPLHFTVDAKLAGSGELVIKPTGPHRKDHSELKVTDNKDSTYSVEYTPSSAGQHTLTITWAGKEVPRSPFHISAFEPSVECGKAIIVGPNQPVDMLVDTGKAGNGILTALCSGEECGSVPVHITGMSPTTQKVSFIPSAEDLYTLSVLLNESEVKGSPFQFDLRTLKKVSEEQQVAPPLRPEEEEPEDGEEAEMAILEATDGTATGELTCYIGTAVLVKVTPSDEDQASADILATATGDNTGPAKIKVIRKSEDLFWILFSPEVVDRYTIEATLNGKPIPKSPVIVNYIMPPTDASKVKLIGLPPHVVDINQEIAVTVDARQAGEGKLNVSCEGPTADNKPPKLEVTPIKGKAHMFHVKYIPTASGNHLLDFKWADKEIPKSPVTMVAVDLATVQLVPYSKPGGIEFDTEYKEKDLKAIAIYEGDKMGTQLKVKIRKVQKNRYSLSFVPRAPGLYLVHVLAKGKDIPGSPFVFRYSKPPIPDAVKVDILSDTGYVGEVTRFNIDAKEAGGGELNIRVTGDGGKETGSLLVEDRKDGSYSVVFTPIAPGKHWFHISWSGKEVPGSPFILTVRDRKDDLPISKVTILDHIPTHLQVNHEISFRVDTRTAGHGDVTVTAEIPSGDLEPPELEVNASKEDPQIYEVSYTPTVSGIHKLHIKWAGESIPASPISIVVSDITTFPFGQPVGLDINADCKTGDLESYAIHQESGNRYKVKISKKEKGKFKLTLEPKEYGLYSIHVLIRQKEITGSPFVVRYDKAAEPEKCTVLDMPVSGYVKKVVAFRVDTREAGSGVLNVKATGPAGSKKAKLKVKKRKDGTYTVEYTPTAAGDHSFVITWGGVAIPGSPFQISIQEEAKMETIEYRLPIEVQPPLIIDAFVEGEEVEGQPQEPREMTLSVGTPLRVVVKTKDKKGTLVSTAHGDSCGFTDVLVSQPKSNTFEALLNPSMPDRYILELKLNGENLPRTPFIIHYILPPTDASKCRILELENIPAQPQPNHEIHFKVDCNGAGQGVLKILSSSPPSSVQPGKLEAKPTKKDPHVFDISYTPPVPGLHILDLLWSEETIPGSPLYFSVASPAQEIIAETMESLFESLLESVQIVETEQPSVVEVGKPMDMGIQTDKAGTITATCSGEQSGKVPVNITSTSSTSHKASFTPTLPDFYELSVFFNGSEVKGSPYHFDLRAQKRIVEEEVLQTVTQLQEAGFVPPGILGPDASKVRLVEKPPRVVDTNKDISLTVDATEAGEGLLEVTADGPSADEQPPRVEMVTSEEKPQIFHIKYVPTASGNHLLTLKWDGQDVPNTPVSIVAVDLATAQIVPYGKPGSIDIDTEHKEKDLKAYAIYEGDQTATQLKVKIHRVQKNRYSLSFHPKEPGLYFLYILAKGKDIPGSPFVLRYAKPPMPDAVKVENLSDTGYVGEVTRFVIDAKEAGSGELNIHAVGIRGKDTGSLSVEDRKDGTYSVEYTPSVPGKQQFQITWAGKAVPGSPLPLTVRDRAAEVLIGEVYLVDRVGDLHSVELPSVEAGVLSEVAATTDKAILVRVKAQTEEQKKADITATARGHRVGPADIQTSRKSPNTFEVMFKPAEADRYTIEVKVGEEMVPVTPFIVNYTSPHAQALLCQIIGLETLTTLVQVDREVVVKVDARRAGDSSLEASLEGPEEEEETPELEVKEEEPFVFRVSFTPKEPGAHVLKLKWGEEAVPGSPLNFNVQGIEVFPHGKIVGLERNVDSTISDLEAYAIHEHSGTRLKIKVSRLHKGRYKLTFAPKEPGMYAVHMLAKKIELPGSPFYVRYDKPPTPEACKVQWLKQKAWVKEVTQCFIDAREAGTGELNVRVTAPTSEEHPNMTISNNKDGTFTATYIPDAAGEHFFNITWDRRDTTGSPFCLTVLEPPVLEEPHEVEFTEEAKVEDGTPPEEFNIPIGQALRVRVTPSGRKQRRVKFVATVTGEKTGSSDIQVSRTASGYQAYFNPMIPDRYTVELKLRDKQLPRSPFIANYFMPATNASKCKILGTDSIQYIQLVNEEVHLKVDSREAGPGSLHIDADGPSKDEVKISKQQRRTYNVSYTPTAPGVHTLNFEFDKQPIPGSPVKLAVGDPKKVSISESPTGVSLKTGEPIAITFDTSKAGCGELTASCKGSKSGEVAAVVNQKSPDRYSVVFTATEVDVYHLSVLWSGHHIRGSPFKVNLTPVDVDKVKTSGPSMPRGVAGPRELILETAEAGKGTITASCINRKGQDMPVSISETSSHVYKVSFQPPQPDVYTLSVQYGGQDINGSPFHINTIPPDANRVKVTEPHKMELYSLLVYKCNCVDAGAGKLTVSCHGVRYGAIPVNMKELDVEQYEISFTPEKEDLYRLSIKWEGEEVPGSPFSANFLPPAQPDKVECGKAVVIGPDQPVDMLIDISKAGGGTLTAQCSGEECGSVPVNIMSTSPTTYKVTFIPSAEDFYKLSVFFSESEVYGSPFEFDLRTLKKVSEEQQVAPPLRPEEEEDGKEAEMAILEATDGTATGELTCYIGTAVLVKVTPSDGNQASAEVLATATGDNTGPAEIMVIRKSEDLFWILFSPEVVDRYTIEATLNGKPIPKSPVIVNYIMPPTDASKVKLIGLPPHVVDINQEIAVTVDARQAGEGKLNVSCEGPTADNKPPKLEVTPIKGKAHMFHVKYIPTASGNHLLDFKWADKEIPKSPVTMVAVDLATVQLVPYSKPGGIDFDTEYKEKDLKAIAIYEGDKMGTQLKVKIRKVQKNRYSLTFVPRAPGLYLVHVLAKGKDIPGSPFVFKYSKPPIPDAVKVEILSDTGYVGEVTRFNIDTKEAGGGELNIRVTGDGGKETGSLLVEDRKDGSYSVVFTPIAPGKHWFHISWSGKEVPDSPFILTVRDRKDDLPISKVTILDHIPTHLQVNHEISFRVDTRAAGHGDVTVTAEIPSGDLEPPELEVNTSKEDPQIYEVSYTPTVAGIHKLHIKWAGESIPASPISIVVSDITTFPFGRPVGLDINADCKTGDLESYAIHQESGNRYKVKISKKEKGKFKLTLEPKEYGLYSIHVLIRQKEITGSPFVVRYDKAAEPEKCMVLDMPVSGYVKKVVAFRVETREAGSGVLNVKATGPAGSKKAKLKVKKRKDGTYTVEYTPTAAGDHSFVITWGGVAILGSPFQISIQEEAKMETIEYRLPIEVQPPLIIDAFVEGVEVEGQLEEPREMTLSVGTPLRVVVKTKDKKGTLVSTAHGDSCGFTDVLVSQPKSNTFEALLNPSMPDRYILELKLNGENLPRTPFIVHYILPPTDASKCRILELENIPAQPQPNHEIHFKVDCNGAGQGVLKILSSSPPSSVQPGKLEAKPTKKDPHVFDISYTPPVPGLHILDLLWSEETIPGSPLYFSVASPAQEIIAETMESLFESLLESVQIVETEQPSVVEVGKPMDMGIQTDKAGTITATCSGEQSGKVPVNITSTSSTSHQVSFTPTLPDSYELSVFFNDSEVKGSPYHFDLRAQKRIVEEEVLQTETQIQEAGFVPPGILGLDASKCHIMYKDLYIFQNPIPLRRAIDFEINTAEAGLGNLKVSLDGPGNTKVELKDQKNGMYRCSLTPSSPGRQQVNLLWNDHHILGSPFTLTVIRPPPIIGLNLEGDIQAGVPHHFQMDCEGLGDGVLEMSCASASAGDIRITPMAGQQSYQCVLLLRELGEQRISVKYNDIHIQGSPFTIHVKQPASTNLQFSLSGAEGVETQHVSAVVESTTTQQQLPVNLMELFTGNYSLEFDPKQGLEYLVTLKCLVKIKAEKQQIKGSPFKLIYGEAITEASSFFIETKPPSEAQAGEVIEFVIDGKAEGELKLTAESSDGGTIIKGQVIRGEGNKSICRIQLPDSGNFLLYLHWNGILVQGFPLQMASVHPPRPEKVKAHGPGLKDGYVNQESTFILDTAEAGNGVLAVHVEGPEGFHIDMKRHPEQEHTIEAQYQANCTGDYKISITWSGVHIPGSPFSVKIKDNL